MDLPGVPGPVPPVHPHALLPAHPAVHAPPAARARAHARPPAARAARSRISLRTAFTAEGSGWRVRCEVVMLKLLKACLRMEAGLIYSFY